MIQVTFRFFNLLAHTVGTNLVRREFEENPSLIHALRALAQEYPTAFQGLFLPDGSINSFLKIWVNGRLIDQDEPGILLHHGDEVLLFPAAAGG